MKDVIQLDKTFEPLGFKRHKNVWNREGSSCVDVADIQMRKGGDAYTLNVGVLDPDIHSTLWGEPRPRFVEQPTCTIAVRIGELIDGRDRWWSINDEDAVEDISRTATAYALPFFERMHGREAMRQWLIETKVVQRRYPPPIINLAILEISSAMLNPAVISSPICIRKQLALGSRASPKLLND